MNKPIAAFPDEALARLVFESQETARCVKAPSSEILERLRQFMVLYRDLAAKPIGPGLLYPSGNAGAGHFQALDRKLVVGRRSKSERHPAGCDVVCDDQQMSRQHFEIELVDGLYQLRDLQSRNGTFVNQQAERITEAVLLREGDIISAGSRSFIFLSDDAGLRAAGC